MSYQTLEIERHDGVATLWMNRPDVYNAFDEILIEELTLACATVAGDAGVRVVVLAGRGRHFSAGADLNWMQRAAANDEAENLADAARFATMLRTLAELPKPTIARVQGAALGGGTGLTAACDMAVAASDASFATSEARFGIIPSVISPYVLRAMGARHALRYFQSAERFDARRAYELGLVQEVVETEQLDAKVAQLAAALVACSPAAQLAAKDLIRAVAGCPIDDGTVAETVRRIAEIRATDEARGGIAAFLEKRPAPWLA